MEEFGMYPKFWSVYLKGGYHSEDFGVDDKIIIELVSEK
jgi:hypothetical protein